MKRYERGILVKAIVADQSFNGPIYHEALLQEAAARFGGRPVACRLTHEQDGAHLGRFTALEYHDNALWGQLVGVAPETLVSMREGARARGVADVGVSINAMGRRHPNNVVMEITGLHSIDILGKSAPNPAAGGMVPFGPDGQPVAWDARQAYWLSLREARIDDAMQRAQIALAERRLQQIEQLQRLEEAVGRAIDRAFRRAIPPRKHGEIIHFTESGGRLLAPIA